MAKPPKSSSSQSPPGEMPQTTPSDFGQPGHDFTLQVVVQMQKDLGALGAKVDRLIDDVDENSKKLDKLRIVTAWVAGGAALLGGLLGAGFAIANLLPWDKIFS